MTRSMFDAIDAAQLPAGALLYAGYVDGNWPSANAISERFPHVVVVRIAVSARTDDGAVLDVENGDATPEEAVNWVLMRRHAGADPTVYCNQSAWPQVRAAFATHDVPEPHWWVARYVNDPSTPPPIPAGAIGIQYYDYGGYDASVIADYWPGVDPTPQGADMSDLVLTGPDQEALIWRVEAIFNNLAASAGGPLKGEPNHLAATLTAIQTELAKVTQPAVDPTALAAALAGNTAFVDAIAAAVVAQIGNDLK